MPISQKIRTLIDNAWADGAPCLLAPKVPTAEHLAKGSMLVYDDEHLAYWERSSAKRWKNLGHDKRVAVIYANFKAQTRGVLESGFCASTAPPRCTRKAYREAIFKRLLKREQDTSAPTKASACSSDRARRRRGGKPPSLMPRRPLHFPPFSTNRMTTSNITHNRRMMIAPMIPPPSAKPSVGKGKPAISAPIIPMTMSPTRRTRACTIFRRASGH